MLFFVKGELKGAYPLPPEQTLALVVAEWETVIKHKQEGKIVAAGALAGLKAGCAIFDVDSNEELHNLVSHLPLFPFIEWEIIPLISPEFALEATKQSLAAVKSSQ